MSLLQPLLICGLFCLPVDFCLWGPPDPNALIGNEEAETVAWCTKPGHGTRVIPAGTLTGVQFLKAPSYVLVAGTINQAGVNINSTDTGGEMDPHGADEVGTPLFRSVLQAQIDRKYLTAWQPPWWSRLH